ncbi:hypothetical protein EON65_42065 [archaeon]|nr:MAG: hypothetical protein EON65_42065 [archaeon]
MPAEELGPAAKQVAAEGFIDHETFTLPVMSPAQAQAQATGGGIETAAGEGAGEAASAGKKRKQPDTGNANKRPNSQINTCVSDQLASTGRTPEAQTRIRSYLRQGVDRLIIASRFRPLPLLKVALYLLAPSSSFVVYHEFMEPLVECYLYLQEQCLAIKLSLSDTWMREFQTLPGRTRPDMFMSTSGGYLLTGIYVGMLPRPFLPKTISHVSSIDI